MNNHDLAKKYRRRRQRLVRGTMKKHKIDTLFITNVPDVRYLSGSVEGAHALVIDGNKSVVFTSKMYEDRVPKEAPGSEVIVVKKKFYEIVGKYLKDRKNRRALGFQGSIMPVNQHKLLVKAMGRRRMVDIKEAVTFVRSIKDPDEIKLIKKCVRIAEKAFLELKAKGLRYFVGRTEKQLAAELEYRMRCLGADRQGFETNGIIVGSGPNSASCHHVPTSRKVRKAEPVLFDWGAELDGYRSDITRVLFMGRPKNEKFYEMYDLVKCANAAGIKAVKAGVYCHKVAEKAWGIFRDRGYQAQIRHGLGHGIGLEIHEQPRFTSLEKPKKNQVMKLRKNMVATIEPGIYYDRLGGVRIEDDVLVTADGRKCLTTVPRDIEKMTLR